MKLINILIICVFITLLNSAFAARKKVANRKSKTVTQMQSKWWLFSSAVEKWSTMNIQISKNRQGKASALYAKISQHKNGIVLHYDSDVQFDKMPSNKRTQHSWTSDNKPTFDSLINKDSVRRASAVAALARHSLVGFSDKYLIDYRLVKNCAFTALGTSNPNAYKFTVMAYEDIDLQTAQTVTNPVEFEVTILEAANGGWGIMDFFYDTFYDGDKVLDRFQSKCLQRNQEIVTKLTNLADLIPSYVNLASLLGSTKKLLNKARTELINELYPKFDLDQAEKVIDLENIEELILSGEFCDEMNNVKLLDKSGSEWMHEFSQSSSLPVCAHMGEKVMHYLVWNPLAQAKKAAWSNLQTPVFNLVKKIGAKCATITAGILEYEPTEGENLQGQLDAEQSSYEKRRDARK